MKKLMIAAAIVCAAAFAQAASVYWTCIDVVTPTSDDGVTGKAWFVNGDAGVHDAMITSLTGAGAAGFSDALADYYSFNGSEGTFSVKSASAVANDMLGVDDGQTGLKAFLVIADSETITDATKFYVTDVQTFTSGTGTNKAQVKWGSQYEDTVVAGNWHNVGAVPEPTSGLLLLLGVAGLALRRRRA